MTLETLEFVIYPDGRVQEKVTGIVGSSCTKVTAEIEAALGRVVSNRPTEEFFEQDNPQSVTTSNQNFTAW
jgi:Protein of unknown function (DUF2997)